jgi:hypothetical protein
MLAGFVLSLGLSVAVQAGSLTSSCERCHLALHERPGWPHVAEWVESAHAAREVGCVRCHNGDATADTPLEAHRFVLPGTRRTSPVHRSRLPATCGQCHPREATRFTGSRHGALLAAGAPNVPSCASCHDAMRARIPSPTALESACAACHRDDPARGQLPSDARVLVEWVAATRERLVALQPLIERDADDVSRRTRWAAFDRAGNRVDDAVGALHAFDLSLARAELLLARDAIVSIEAARTRRAAQPTADSRQPIP